MLRSLRKACGDYRRALVLMVRRRPALSLAPRGDYLAHLHSRRLDERLARAWSRAGARMYAGVRQVERERPGQGPGA